ncbi:hypothetical protein ABT024_03290 [Streptomyces sp. NPDC002812]|uniref:hypothetical protein n=1 Tax=Streptomyces sp. NPDC002812 TaxID=3154434 RepID=UPI003325C968
MNNTKRVLAAVALAGAALAMTGAAQAVTVTEDESSMTSAVEDRGYFPELWLFELDAVDATGKLR